MAARRHQQWVSANAWAVGLAGLLAALLYTLPLLGGRVYGGMDQDRMELGYLCEMRSLLSDGLSGVSRRLGNGQPTFAEPQMEWFYPPRWVFLALDEDTARRASVVFHMTLAAAGMALLLRVQRRRVWTSVVGGVAFVLTGTVLDLVRHGVFLVGAAWLPWAWACGLLVLRGRSRAAAAGLPLALGALLLGGEPHALVMALLVLMLEGVRVPRRMPHLAWGALLGALLGMVQWIPFSLASAVTGRRGPLPVTEMLAWGFDRPLWWATLLPGVMQWHADQADWLDAVFTGSSTVGSTWNANPYLGLLLVALAVASLHRPPLRVACAAALVALLLALGDATPAGTLMTWIPVVNRLRYPAKYLLLLNAALVPLAMAHLDLLPTPSWRRRLAPILAALALFPLGALLFPLATTLPPLLQADMRFSAWHGLAALLLGALCVGLKSPRALALVLLGDLLGTWLVALPLVPSTLDLPSTLPPLMLSGHPAPVLCAAPSYAPPPGQGALAPNVVAKVTGEPYVHACDHISSARHYGALSPRVGDRLDAALQDGVVAAARTLGCTHAVMGNKVVGLPADFRQQQPPGWADLGLTPENGVTMIQLLKPLPLGTVVVDPRFVSSEQDVVPALIAAGENVLGVVDSPLTPWTGTLPDGHGAHADGVRSPSPDTWEVDLSGRGGAVVMVRTSFHVGWQAHQGDTPLPVVRVGGFHVGAVVSDVTAGPVLFTFETAGLETGMALTVLGLVLLGITVLRARR